MSRADEPVCTGPVRSIGDEPAFPVADSHYANGQVQYGDNGMTKREYFAAMAMQGIMANPQGQIGGLSSDAIAICATKYADALLAALEGK